MVIGSFFNIINIFKVIMKKRILSSLLLVTLVAGSLAACQEGNN
jgi:hypothetical protein